MISESQIQNYKQELLAKYPDEYWVIVNYGYGDGGCDGPYDAFHALVEYQNQRCRNAIEEIDKGLPWNKNYVCSLVDQFESARDETMIHSISDYDRNEDFQDFMSS